MRSKSKAGSVGIQSRKGFLCLQLPRKLYGGEIRRLYLNLLDTPENRKFAEAKAQQIQADITFERFDFTLKKYKGQVAPVELEIDIRELWAAYTSYKTNFLEESSLKNFRQVANHLAKISLIDLRSPRAIRRHLIAHCPPDTARRVLMQLGACCNWAVDEGQLEKNPFAELKSLKVSRQRSIDPFSVEEKDMIIGKFEESSYYAAYTPLVKFLFWTGCRPSEAIALQWKHIDPPLKTIFFQEAVVEGRRKSSTKTHKSRQFPINQQLRELLLSLKLSEPEGSDLIFRSPHGKTIDLHNFTTRAWKAVLAELPIRYRPTYNTRHTFITLCIASSIPIPTVACWVGNSPQVLLNHYAGFVSMDVPEI